MDTEAANFWRESAETLRWGRYLTQIESHAIRDGLGLCARPPKTGIDIGSEAGRFTGMLIEEGIQVTCTEICPNKVRQCQRIHPTSNCVLVTPDDTTLPVETRSIDFAISIEVEVVEREWFAPELARVLTEGGVAVFTLNNRHSYRAAVSNIVAMMRRDEPYYNVSCREVEERVRACGLAIEKKIGFGWAPFGRFSNSRLVAPVTWAEDYLRLRQFARWSPWVAFICQKPSTVS